MTKSFQSPRTEVWGMTVMGSPEPHDERQVVDLGVVGPDLHAAGPLPAFDVEDEVEQGHVLVHLEVEAVDVVVGQCGKDDPGIAVLLEMVLVLAGDHRGSPGPDSPHPPGGPAHHPSGTPGVEDPALGLDVDPLQVLELAPLGVDRSGEAALLAHRGPADVPGVALVAPQVIAQVDPLGEGRAAVETGGWHLGGKLLGGKDGKGCEDGTGVREHPMGPLGEVAPRIPDLAPLSPRAAPTPATISDLLASYDSNLGEDPPKTPPPTPSPMALLKGTLDVL